VRLRRGRSAGAGGGARNFFNRAERGRRATLDYKFRKVQRDKSGQSNRCLGILTDKTVMSVSIMSMITIVAERNLAGEQ
jgi:hypothetical protein